MDNGTPKGVDYATPCRLRSCREFQPYYWLLALLCQTCHLLYLMNVRRVTANMYVVCLFNVQVAPLSLIDQLVFDTSAGRTRLMAWDTCSMRSFLGKACGIIIPKNLWQWLILILLKVTWNWKKFCHMKAPFGGALHSPPEFSWKFQKKTSFRNDRELPFKIAFWDRRRIEWFLEIVLW